MFTSTSFTSNQTVNEALLASVQTKAQFCELVIFWKEGNPSDLEGDRILDWMEEVSETYFPDFEKYERWLMQIRIC